MGRLFYDLSITIVTTTKSATEIYENIRSVIGNVNIKIQLKYENHPELCSILGDWATYVVHFWQKIEPEN